MKRLPPSHKMIVSPPAMKSIPKPNRGSAGSFSSTKKEISK